MPVLIGGMMILICHSCSTCSRPQTTIEDITIGLADPAIDTTFVNIAHTTLYALPTPIEMSMMIKNSGISYQSALLNNPSNASKYLMNHKMALNFGVYITDLTYAGLFEQSQTVLRYKNAVLQLIEGLGLQSAITPDIMQQLDANINNRDAVMKIISDMYVSCSASLNEDDRYALTLAILTGGWVEGMYIATSMIDENLDSDKDRMNQLVINMKLTFDMIWMAMSELKDISEVSGLIDEMSALAQTVNYVNVNQTPNEVTLDSDGKSNIVSASIHNVTPEVYVKIKDQIRILRTNFTKK